MKVLLLLLFPICLYPVYWNNIYIEGDKVFCSNIIICLDNLNNIDTININELFHGANVNNIIEIQSSKYKGYCYTGKDAIYIDIDHRNGYIINSVINTILHESFHLLYYLEPYNEQLRYICTNINNEEYSAKYFANTIMDYIK